MDKKAATIKDIAKFLGISTSTVSRALSGMPNVDQMTREAVNDLAKQLGYKPNLQAARQVKKRSYNIGVIIPSFTIYFYSEALSGIHDGAVPKGYNVMICQTNESYEQEKKCIDLLASSQVEAIIISVSRETKDYDHLFKVIDRGIPVIMFNRVCDIPGYKVTVNDYEGAFKMTEHLISSGCNKIMHIAGPSLLQNARNRLNGYKDALVKHKIAVDESLILTSDFTFKDGYSLGMELFKNDSIPDAIFCVCDAVAYGILEAARELNVKIPEKVKLAGFTDEPHSVRLRPQLSSVHQPIFEIGEKAMELAIFAIENPNEKPRHEVLKTTLNLRQSTH